MIKKKILNSISLLYFDKYLKQYSIIASLIILISFLFPRGEVLKYTYQINDIASDAIIAPFTFPILKSEEKLKLDLSDKKKSIPYIFNRSDQIVSQSVSALTEFFNMIKDLRNAYMRLDQSKKLVYENRYNKQYEKARLEYISDSTNLEILSNNFSKLYPFVLNKVSWNDYVSLPKNLKDSKELIKHSGLILQICRNRWSEGIYDINIKDIFSRKVTVNQNELPIIASPENFNDLELAWIKSKKELISSLNEADEFLDLGYDLIIEFMKPNLLFDQQLTEKKQNESLDKVPRSQGVVLKNELIVDANVRVTKDVLLKLSSLAHAVMQKEKRTGFLQQIQGFFGRIILLSVILSLFFAFLGIYKKNIFEDWKMVLLISIVFIIQLMLSNIILLQLELSEYLIPFTIGAMTLTILFDAQVGFMAIASMAILMGLMMGQGIDLIVVSLFCSTVAIYNIRRLRKRSQLFSTMFALIAASFFVAIGLGLFKDNSWEIIFRDIQFLAINSILAPIFTYGLVGVFEMFFDITTDLTLIELLDYDHPLLKRAQQETNGTFNHSIVVGNLAEACANSIGAHSLLCRVGAYYHDIGKMKKSEYFIENQFGADNKHNKITATMSARIIRAHVKDGLQLAKEYRLPKVVSDFIPMHHGTTRVEYFYQMALQQAENDKTKVDESAFRYPGPKPNTKETGILMLCEAIEAAVRSIKEPDIRKIESMIDKIIKQRIEDGQLSECPLTLDELRKIKGKVDGTSGMLPVLRGIYHIRVEYPDDKKLNHRT